MKQVNIFCGRFQPFHKGHLNGIEEAYKKNGLKTVLLVIHNRKFDKKKPFSDELIGKEINTINSKYIEDVIWVNWPMPAMFTKECRKKGYEPVLWLAGHDRIEDYKKLLQSKQYKEVEANIEMFEIPRVTSATEVRQAIKNDDINKYKELMPQGTDKLFDEFKDEISKIDESLISLSDYIDYAQNNEE